MVSIDPKALEHACLCAGRSVHHFDRMGDDLPLRASIVAHARAIERLEATEARHAAELREQAERFSEAVCEWRDADTPAKAAKAAARLHDFILPAPDPLVEAMADCGVDRFESWADQLHAALAARGYEVRKIEHTPPAGGSDAE